ncbi:cytochrome P450, partial [Phascolomyces articulosus]
VLYRLLQHPEVTEELLKEQQQVLQESGLDPNGKSVDVFTCDVLKKMLKLDSVVRESLRLRNQFYELPHTNIRNHNVVLSNGTIIPPDRDVLINLWHNHHHGEGEENIGEFKPFRFVDTRYPATKVGDNYLVFGEGKHACP